MSARRTHWDAAALFLCCSPALSTLASAADPYPNKVVRIVAPMAPGGSTDVMARIVSQKLAEKWAQSVIVDNRVGASGNVGSEMVAKSAPDGYTLLVAGAPTAINMSLFRNLRFDLAKDFSAITAVASFPSLIAVHPSLPAFNVKELIALARAHPDQLNFGSAGNGSPNHLSMELFKSMANVKMIHIPYKGSGQVMTDLIAGQLQLASVGLPPAMPMVSAGKLRVIAVTSLKRSPLLPAAPTVSESGLSGFEVSSWQGLFAPAGLPRDVLTRINGDMVNALAGNDIKDRLATLGAEPMPMSPEDFARFVQAEIAKWAKVVKVSGATID
jgi:tripartite-type tricarboxylate transporter receptor subunit TctC